MFSVICNKYAEKIRLLPNKMTFLSTLQKSLSFCDDHIDVDGFCHSYLNE